MPMRQFTVTALKTVTVSSLSYSCAQKKLRHIFTMGVYVYLPCCCCTRSIYSTEIFLRVNHEHERGYDKCSPEQRQQWRTIVYRGNLTSRTKSNSNAGFGATTFDRNHNINDTPERHPLLSSGAWWSVLFSISLCYASVCIHAYGSSSTIPTVEAHSTKSPRAQQQAC